MSGTGEVQAAGGVIVRGGLVCVVHRPRYDDWSLPKGKLDRGESFEEAALREIEEETGLRCTLDRELPEARYESRGRPKVVRYWLMSVVGEADGERDDEVDELRWLAPAEAAALMTYPRDEEIIRAAFAGG